MSVNNVYEKLKLFFNFIFGGGGGGGVGRFLIVSITKSTSPIYFATAPKKGSGTLRG